MQRAGDNFPQSHDGMSFWSDADMEAALAASVADSQRIAGVTLDTRAAIERASILRKDKHSLQQQEEAIDERIMQINCLNQFHCSVLDISQKEFNGPNSICGMLSVAYALLLERQFSDATSEVLTTESLETIVALLKDENMVHPLLRLALGDIIERRNAFYADDLPEVRTAMQKQWVANYEIGDFLARNSESRGNTHFVRHNQYPLVDTPEATKDERAKILAEEARFGGRLVNSSDGEADFSRPGDTVYFVQTSFGVVGPESQGQCEYFTPEEWQAKDRDRDRDRTRKPQVVVIDLNGHYVCALACRLLPCQQTDDSAAVDGSSSNRQPSAETGAAAVAESAEAEAEAEAVGRGPVKSGDGVGVEPGPSAANALIIFNTTDVDYTSWPQAAWTFDEMVHCFA